MKLALPSAKTITGGTILGGSIIGPSTVAGLRGDEIHAIALENKELSDENLRITEEKDNWQQSFDRQRNHSIWVLDVKEKEIQDLARKVEIYEKGLNKAKAKIEKYRSEIEKKEKLIGDLDEQIKNLEANINDVDEHHRRTIEELEREVVDLARNVYKNEQDKLSLTDLLNSYKRENMKVSEYVRYLQGVLNHFTQDNSTSTGRGDS